MFILKFPTSTGRDEYLQGVVDGGFQFTPDPDEAREYDNIQEAFADMAERGANFGATEPSWGWPVPVRVEQIKKETELTLS